MPQPEIRKPNKPPPPPPPPPKSPRLPLRHETNPLGNGNVEGGECAWSEYAESTCSAAYSTRSLQPPTRSVNQIGCHHSSCRSESSYSVHSYNPNESPSCLGCSCVVNNLHAPCCASIRSCGCQPVIPPLHCGLIPTIMAQRPRVHSPCNALNHGHHSHVGPLISREHQACGSSSPFHAIQQPARSFNDLQHKPLPPIPVMCHDQHFPSTSGQTFQSLDQTRLNHVGSNLNFSTMANSSTSASNSYNHSGSTGVCGSSSEIGSTSTTSNNNFKTSLPLLNDEPITRIVSQAGLQTPLPSSDIPPPLPPINPELRSQPLLNKLAHSLSHIPSASLPNEPNNMTPPGSTSNSHANHQQVPLGSSGQTQFAPVQQPPRPLPPAFSPANLPPPNNISTLANIQHNNTRSNFTPPFLNGSSNQHNQQPVNLQQGLNSVNQTRTSQPTLGIDKNMEHKQNRHEFDRVHKSNQPPNTCNKCGNKVLPNQEACKAMDQIYHASCFVCCRCNKTLIRETFWHEGGRVYCEEDFKRLTLMQNTEKCAECFQPIHDLKLLVMGKSYHPKCFKCCVCGLCLDGVPFTIDIKNKFYCIDDYHSLHSPKCAACGKSITPIDGTYETVRVVSMDKDYHVDCYCCEDCGLPLTDEKPSQSYPLDNHLLCKSCHINRLTKMQAALTIS